MTPFFGTTAIDFPIVSWVFDSRFGSEIPVIVPSLTDNRSQKRQVGGEEVLPGLDRRASTD
jgi:hypothetical protein